ncbi:LysE family transporter [Streptomyces sp. NBC_01178]|uniref:LysE family transporter n=1 Tax=Streptomyces sp. NBC_01178 TaxID=2903762 RepID=UPI003868700E|nr:LysE family transporter [Streptomyces sp. NBC_01178]
MSVDLMGFLGVVLIAYAVPGPDFLVVFRSAVEHLSQGRAAGLGAQAGLCVHMLAAAVGLAVLAARSPAVYAAIKLLGAAYLVHLGVRAVLAARRAARERPVARKAEGEGPSTGGRGGDRRRSRPGFPARAGTPSANGARSPSACRGSACRCA